MSEAPACTSIVELIQTVLMFLLVPRVGFDFFGAPRTGIETSPGPFSALAAGPFRLRSSRHALP